MGNIIYYIRGRIMKRVIRIIEKGIDKFELWVKSIIYGNEYVK